MLLLFGALFAGLLAGFLIRGRARLIRVTHGAITVSIFAMLFLLGLSVGANDAITSSLARLGLEALVLSFGSTAGSVALVYLLYRGFAR